ncbi:hypothetical protein, partial [Sphingopyxis bauzanensis]|uniref:hypothetical protein n=1 Tax=Sphingopyxis bauzanensis TaxID=651663 RepID=UPI001E2E41A0
RNAAHDQIGIVRSFKSECCARSRRNAAHDQIGTLRAMTSESAAAIQSHLRGGSIALFSE